MIRIKGEGGGSIEGEGGRQELSYVDQLIADAEELARAAGLAANKEELETTASKKKVSGEAARHAEEFQHFFASLRAQDAFVEDYSYESVFYAYEKQMNIARPPKIQASIEALKKTGNTLRKLGAMDQISLDLEQKMQALQTLHDKLFDEVQEATVNALEAVKNKFKGEETEFERRYKTLSDSPLVKGIEYDHDSPEAREKALKQDIVQVVLGPIAESRLKGMETDLKNKKSNLITWKAEYDKLSNQEKPLWGLQDFFNKIKPDGSSQRNRNETHGEIEYKIVQFFEGQQKEINAIEQAIPRDRLAFEMNRMIIDETLAEEHDETTLREAFVAIRAFLVHARERVQERNSRDIGQKFPFDNQLASLILGRLHQYGAEMPRIDGFYYGTNPYETIPVNQQIIGHQISTQESAKWEAADHLNGYASHGFTRAKLTGATGEYLGMGHGSTPDSASVYYDRLGENERDKDLRRAYPTKEAYLQAMFGGEARFFNMLLAYRKVARGLLVKGRTRLPEESLGAEALKTVGWKESRLGALVDPEQSVRDADREYALFIERFSRPQVEAEALFDVRGEQGEFHVYTTDQAVGLLRRARRDARDIVLNVDRTLEEGQAGIASERNSMQAQIKSLEEKEKKAAARQQQLEGQLQEQEGDAKRNMDATKTSNQNEIRRIEKKQRELMERLREKLQTALGSKSGFFSGDKDLRMAIARIMEELPTNKE
ncbi:MAG TPA: hypothetical protein VJB64_02320 [Patescibacteria group bacterium]|nr:hypothetical protein [Patescibacteria group bacterium]